MNGALKRIVIDIKDLNKSPIDNIHYFPDENNIFEGRALIIGPLNTPYQYGNYLFEFKFCSNYPYTPPKVSFKSNDGKTRFNPNLYRNGKVCLSILNTWSGEQWSACQSIRSILITLQMTLNDIPLLNEPGVSIEMHKRTISYYNKIIQFKNLEFTIIHYLNNLEQIPFQDDEIIDTMIKHFEENKDDIKTYIEKLNQVETFSKVCVDIYEMRVNLDYRLLYNRFMKLYKIKLK